MKAKTVIFICHGTNNPGGADYSMINLIEALGDNIHPIVLTRGGKVSELLRQHHLECIIFPFKLNLANPNRWVNLFIRFPRGLWDSIVNRLCIAYVRHRLHGREVLVVHSNSSVFDIGYSLARSLSAKHIWHIREFQDLDFGMRPFKGWQDLYRKIHQADHVIAITHAIYNHWKLNECKASVLYNAVRKESDVCFCQKKQHYFLFCASKLNDAKGTRIALTIFGKSGLGERGYSLKFIGQFCNDAYKDKMMRLAREYHVEDSVEFLGYQSNIKPFMSHASAFLMCSEFEAMGRVTVEAMFYGCPVLGHNTGGTKEIIDDGVDGYLYNGIEDGVEKLIRLINNPTLTESMARCAQRKALSTFSVEAYREKIKALYSEVIGSRE